jgi:diaminohydroxyphosphoribosylaminopyrimidine deaminase/5-amino-6-(5-phosphoribosylamino)uracil reductase
VSTADRGWLERAIALSHRCPPSEEAYSVGAVLVDGSGVEIASGYSRETDPKVHAEEAALERVPVGDPRLTGATLYSSLEPCSERRSRPRSCVRLILDAGIPRVVIAWKEPDLFVADARGCELLREAGVTVVEMPELAALARAPNAHLLSRRPA